MTVVGFIPGLDVISDVYFLGKSLVDVAMGRGSWADVAMNAAALLLPVGGSVFRMAKKAVNALDGASDAARMANKAGDVAKASKAIGKIDDVGDAKRTSNLAESASEVSPGSSSQVTKPYKRPSGSTTPEQRASVQGKPCVTCGQAAPKMYADHKTPLVKEYYTTGGIDEVRMRSVDAVQPQCPACSNRQGAGLSQYSREMREVLSLGP